MMRRLLLFACLLLAARAQASTVAVTVPFSTLIFSPRTITVAVGDTVQWSGLSAGHNVGQSTGPAAVNSTGGAGGDFYSGPPGTTIDTYSFTFNSAGDFYYVCDAHGGGGLDMRGLIEVVTATATPTETPVVSPTDTETPGATPSPTPTISLTPVVSPTFTLTPNSFAGIQDARLVINPVTGGVLHLWAHLLGVPDAVQLRGYSAAYTRVLNVDLAAGPGDQRWNVDVSALPAGPLWLQLWVQQRGDWRRGPVLRSYVIK
jgi:plastocyanin